LKNKIKNWRIKKMIKHVMVATDGSENGGKAVELGALIAAENGATVHLVHAAPENYAVREAKGLKEAEHMTLSPKRVYITARYKI
jgi:nucleotide-binding universal stress UspA family protein